VGLLQSDSSNSLANLLQLESEILKSDSIAALSFILVNQSRRLVQYEQAILWRTRSNKLHLEKASGVSSADSNSPYLQSFSRLVNRQLKTTTVVSSTSTIISNDKKILFSPLFDGQGDLQGALTLSRSQPYSSDEVMVIERLSLIAGVVLGAHCQRTVWRDKLVSWFKYISFKKALSIFAITVLLLFPIKRSALAPMEIVAVDPVIVTAPIDGIIKEVVVESNQLVMEGDTLYLLDERDLKGMLQIEQDGVAVARAELLLASQQAFENSAGDEVKSLRSKLQQQEARVVWVEHQLQQLAVTSPIAGVVISTNSKSWRGKPVSVGEKIVTVANPDRVKVEMWLPVEDLLSPGADKVVELYLYRDSSKSYYADLEQIGYSAELSPQGVLSYRAVATVEDSKLFRIGERGSAKIEGEQTTLFLYLFRKPLLWLKIWLS
jgi:biotin carboxyl carrier protein